MSAVQKKRPNYKKGVKGFDRNKKADKERSSKFKEKSLREGFKIWTSFYRANPHRFATEYLGMNLHLFQKMMLYLMFKVNLWELIAARGLGKSWLVATFSVIRCILFPGTMIVIASG